MVREENSYTKGGRVEERAFGSRGERVVFEGEIGACALSPMGTGAFPPEMIWSIQETDSCITLEPTLRLVFV